MVINTLHSLIRYRLHRLGFRSEFLELEYCKLHFFQRYTCNNSKHVVLIHGLGTSASTWVKILPSLLDYGTITCVDLPGFGFSKIKSRDSFFSIEQIDKSLENFFQRTNQLPVTLIGHSLGGWLAARFAIRNQSQVEHLILINNAGISCPGVIEQAELFKIKSIDDVRNLLDHMWFRYPWYFKPFTLSVYHSLQKKHISEFISSIQETDFLNSTFSSLTMHVDVIWGSEDRLIPVDSVSVMKQFYRICLHTSFPNVGMYLNWNDQEN